MQTVSEAWLEAVRGHRTIDHRVTILDASGDEVEQLTGSGGYALDFQVMMNRTINPRRMASLVISSPDGLFRVESLSSYFYLNGRFSIESGIRLADNTWEWHSLGRFMVDQPTESYTVSDSILTIRASDYWKRGYKRKNRTSLVLERSMRLEQVALELGALMGFDISEMSIDDDGRTMGADYPVEAWQDVPALFQDLMAQHALEVYLDHVGVLTVAPAPVNSNLPASVMTLAEGSESVLLSITKGLDDSNLYNSTLVVAEGAQRPTVVGEARDLNPNSPAYNPPPGYDPDWPLGGGPLGDRLYPVQVTAALADEYAAVQYAERLLFENALVEKTYDLTVLPLSALVPGDVVKLLHADSGTDSDLLLDSINISSGEAGDMSISVKEVRSLVAP